LCKDVAVLHVASTAGGAFMFSAPPEVGDLFPVYIMPRGSVGTATRLEVGQSRNFSPSRSSGAHVTSFSVRALEISAGT
jgi:hypothetical protein